MKIKNLAQLMLLKWQIMILIKLDLIYVLIIVLSVYVILLPHVIIYLLGISNVSTVYLIVYFESQIKMEQKTDHNIFEETNFRCQDCHFSNCYPFSTHYFKTSNITRLSICAFRPDWYLLGICWENIYVLILMLIWLREHSWL